MSIFSDYNLKAIESIAEKMTSQVTITDDDYRLLFTIGAQKKQYFTNSNIDLTHYILVTSDKNIRNVCKTINKTLIPSHEFLELSLNSNEFCEFAKGKLILLTNNDLASFGYEILPEFRERIKHSIICIHDWDSHHWYKCSLFSALIADHYVPAHLNYHTLTHVLNQNFHSFTPAGTMQWSREFIIENLIKSLTKSRMSEAIGFHNYYQQFTYRNLVISTLSKSSKYVGFNNFDYNQLTDSDRFEKWSSHKYSWIIPTSTDLPIRFFDSLVTGSVPLIPTTLVNYMEILNIPSDYYHIFNNMDIIEPNKFIDRIECNSNIFSSENIYNRVIYTINKFHYECIADHIFKKVINF